MSGAWRERLLPVAIGAGFGLVVAAIALGYLSNLLARQAVIDALVADPRLARDRTYAVIGAGQPFIPWLERGGVPFRITGEDDRWPVLNLSLAQFAPYVWVGAITVWPAADQPCITYERRFTCWLGRIVDDQPR